MKDDYISKEQRRPLQTPLSVSAVVPVAEHLLLEVLDVSAAEHDDPLRDHGVPVRQDDQVIGPSLPPCHRPHCHTGKLRHGGHYWSLA